MITTSLARLLGVVWASPLTLPAFFFYILPLQLFGHYRYVGWTGQAWRWACRPSKCPSFIQFFWRRFGPGHTIGNIIVTQEMLGTSTESMLAHFHCHVRQCMRLGVFMPVAYYGCWFVIRLFLPHCNPRYSNPFEVDARRAAGQMVDIEGFLKRLRQKK